MSGYSFSLGSPTVTINGAESADQTRLLLGKDIYFDGDYRVTAAGDWLTVEGEEAVRQAVYRRLLTRPGEYRVRPSYGCGVQSYVRKRNRPSEREELIARIKSNLLEDDRIEAVSSVIVDVDEDTLIIKVAVKINGRTLTFQPFKFTEEGFLDSTSSEL